MELSRKQAIRKWVILLSAQILGLAAEMELSMAVISRNVCDFKTPCRPLSWYLFLHEIQPYVGVATLACLAFTFSRKVFLKEKSHFYWGLLLLDVLLCAVLVPLSYG